MTDAEVDAMLASGDHEAAALAAAELENPTAFREAMIRAFAVAKTCKRCSLATNFSDPSPETPNADLRA